MLPMELYHLPKEQYGSSVMRGENENLLLNSPLEMCPNIQMSSFSRTSIDDNCALDCKLKRRLDIVVILSGQQYHISAMFIGCLILFCFFIVNNNLENFLTKNLIKVS